MEDLASLLSEQAQYFSSGATRPLSMRRAALLRLRRFLVDQESLFLSALEQDLGKPSFESIGGELLPILQEIDFALIHLESWAEAKEVARPQLSYTHLGTRSFLQPEPLGQCLILGAWNYPVQLSLLPVVSAVAAGNVVILKPSELADSSSKILESCVQSVFDPAHVSCLRGGVSVSQELLRQRFDKIFFTGSSKIGKEVMKAAAEHLTPVCLELGGKSACFVDEESLTEHNLRKILWGKFFNSGQTCVAPDYLLYPAKMKAAVVEISARILQEFYGDSPLTSKDLAKIVNQKHFERLLGLLKDSKVVVGGQSNFKERKIAPSLLLDVRTQDPCMQEEIFGPLLPLVAYESDEEALEIIHSYGKALVIYAFSKNKKRQKMFVDRTSSGSLVFNDVMIQMTQTSLPFGGVGESGMGRYHGQYGFEEFSHTKAIQIKTWGPSRLRYPPYKKTWKWWMRRFI